MRHVLTARWAIWPPTKEDSRYDWYQDGGRLTYVRFSHRGWTRLRGGRSTHHMLLESQRQTHPFAARPRWDRSQAIHCGHGGVASKASSCVLPSAVRKERRHGVIHFLWDSVTAITVMHNMTRRSPPLVRKRVKRLLRFLPRFCTLPLLDGALISERRSGYGFSRFPRCRNPPF